MSAKMNRTNEIKQLFLYKIMTKNIIKIRFSEVSITFQIISTTVKPVRSAHGLSGMMVLG